VGLNGLPLRKHRNCVQRAAFPPSVPVATGARLGNVTPAMGQGLDRVNTGT